MSAKRTDQAERSFITAGWRFAKAQMGNFILRDVRRSTFHLRSEKQRGFSWGEEVFAKFRQRVTMVAVREGRLLIPDFVRLEYTAIPYPKSQ